MQLLNATTRDPRYRSPFRCKIALGVRVDDYRNCVLSYTLGIADTFNTLPCLLPSHILLRLMVFFGRATASPRAPAPQHEYVCAFGVRIRLALKWGARRQRGFSPTAAARHQGRSQSGRGKLLQFLGVYLLHFLGVYP
jgi:hypothetical protein